MCNAQGDQAEQRLFAMCLVSADINTNSIRSVSQHRAGSERTISFDFDARYSSSTTVAAAAGAQTTGQQQPCRRHRPSAAWWWHTWQLSTAINMWNIIILRGVFLTLTPANHSVNSRQNVS